MQERINAQDGEVDKDTAQSGHDTDLIAEQYDNLMTATPTLERNEDFYGAQSGIDRGEAGEVTPVMERPKDDENEEEQVFARSGYVGNEELVESTRDGADGYDQTTAESDESDRQGNSSPALDSTEGDDQNATVQEVKASIITGDRMTEVNIAAMDIFNEIRANSLPYSIKKTGETAQSCEGKYVFVYDLPSEFNTELINRCDSLFPWFNLCDYFSDSGIGKPVNSMDNGTQIFVPADRWFSTHQYALELISHARIMKYKCRTEDPDLASLFYIPYYGGLDVIRWHFDPNATNENRDALGWKLVRWLENKPSWTRRGGIDHVLVLGKISWDFRRQDSGSWGSRLLEFPDLQKVMRVLIERNPWAKDDIGAPHPTYFHPSSASDIDAWLHHVKRQERTSLVTFVGKERRDDPANVRSALVEQCREAFSEADCRFVECNKNLCQQPAYVIKAFLMTHFCMQPVGDSPTRRSLFDSLIAGCIPVLFHPQTAYLQYPWHLPQNESSWSVYISEDEVRAGRINVIDVLKKISTAERSAMRETIINSIIPGLIYSIPGSDVSPYRDAFDITIDQLLYRSAQGSDLQ